MGTELRKCCFMYDAERRCEKDAEWKIFPDPPSDPYYDTEVCTDHVGPLLDDSPKQIIYPIGTEEPSEIGGRK